MGFCQVTPFRFCAIDLFWILSSRVQHPPAVRLPVAGSQSLICALPPTLLLSLFFFPLTLLIWWDFYGKKKHQPAVGTSVYLLIFEPLPPNTWISLSASLCILVTSGLKGIEKCLFLRGSLGILLSIIKGYTY